MSRVSKLAVTCLTLAVSACGGGESGAPSSRASEPEDEALGSVALALTDSDPVSDAVTSSCTTTSVKGLSTQLVSEIQCMRPGSMKSIEGVTGLTLGAAVFPYLQTPAADALMAAQKARGTTMSINSALRTLPQQYLLYRWYKLGRCNIGLAAAPGNSNHEGAIAVDINDAQAWRPAMANADFRWLGASDPVHFDFTGAGAIDMRGLSVTAFQRLWNRNHPEDPIGEDGDYGPETEKRLARAPVGGFSIGAESCSADAAAPPPAPAPPVPPPDAVPDATEEPPAAAPEESGCSMSALGAGEAGSARAALLAAAALFVVARSRARRRRTRDPRT